MIHKFTYDGQNLNLHAVKFILTKPQRSPTIMLHETLFCKDIMYFLLFFRLAYDKSESCEHHYCDKGSRKFCEKSVDFHGSVKTL